MKRLEFKVNKYKGRSFSTLHLQTSVKCDGPNVTLFIIYSLIYYEEFYEIDAI